VHGEEEQIFEEAGVGATIVHRGQHRRFDPGLQQSGGAARAWWGGGVHVVSTSKHGWWTGPPALYPSRPRAILGTKVHLKACRATCTYT
jgi:hypothetical protein